MWDQLYEHSDQIEMFRRSIVRGRLSHAYLFCGPSGIGKATFARLLAQALLCERMPDEEFDACGECNNCKRCVGRTHPDILEVGLPEGKSAIPIAVFAGEKERRGRAGLCYEISLRPMSGTRRIAIINDAESMNVESTNALLKTLEEPPEGCVIILISTNVTGVLPTIRSRCQLVRFRALSDQTVARLLVERELIENADDASAVAALANGSVSTAMQLADSGLRDLRRQLYDGLAKGKSMQPLILAAALSDGISELGGGTPAQRKNAEWLIAFAMEFFRQAIRLQASPQTTSDVPQVQSYLRQHSSGGVDLCGQLLERIYDARDHVAMHTAVPLVFEGLFYDLATIMRKAG